MPKMRIKKDVISVEESAGDAMERGASLMKTFAGIAVGAAGLFLTPVAATAHERVTDAALGGLAGAVVFGPVGLVAGGVIGYTAGPHIACKIGAKRCYRRAHGRHDHPRR
jgi:hypothetical protein